MCMENKMCNYIVIFYYTKNAIRDIYKFVLQIFFSILIYNWKKVQSETSTGFFIKLKKKKFYLKIVFNV
jgi:hypothetical protein